MKHARVFARFGPFLEHFDLADGERLLIGRCEQASIRLRGWSTSRRHAYIEFRDGRLYLTDLGSEHGTQVDGTSLAPHTDTALTEASSVWIGNYELRTAIVEGPEDRETQRLRYPSFLPSGEFQIIDQLGDGAVGEVWAAYQSLLERRVAIKRLRKEYEPDSEGYKRFLREARLYTTVRSPHLLELYDIRVEPGGAPYLLLELVDGMTALELLEHGPLTVSQALRIAEDVTRGLAALHGAGIVHRDVKPSNVLIGAEGQAKLGDLGVAKVFGSEELTKTGIGIGSLPYTAPEQIVDAKRADARSDLYGLGVTLWQLLTRRVPFDSDTLGLMQLMERVVHEQLPPVRLLRPDCPEEVSAFVGQLVEKTPDKRPRAAADVAQRLHALWEGIGALELTPE